MDRPIAGELMTHAVDACNDEGLLGQVMHNYSDSCISFNFLTFTPSSPMPYSSTWYARQVL